MAWEGGILALDLATRTGWAFGVPGAVPIHGSVRFAREGATRARVLRGCREWLEAFMAVNAVRLAVFESPITPEHVNGHTNIDTIRLLIGLAEIVDEMLHDRVDVREARVHEVARFFIGPGRRRRPEKKAATIARCRAIGWMPADDNAADALALWAYQASIVDHAAMVGVMPLWGAR